MATMTSFFANSISDENIIDYDDDDGHDTMAKKSRWRRWWWRWQWTQQSTRCRTMMRWYNMREYMMTWCNTMRHEGTQQSIMVGSQQMSGQWWALHATINCWWQLGGRRREKVMSLLWENKGGGMADTILWKFFSSSKSTPNLHYTLPGAEREPQPIPCASGEEDCSISAMMGSCLGSDQGMDWMGDCQYFFCHNL